MISLTSGDRKAISASSKASTASQSSASADEDGMRSGGRPRVATADAHSRRRRRRLEEFPTDELPDQAVADQARESDTAEVVRRALDRLPQRMRTTVMLRYFEDMTEPEIAAALGISLGTVKSTVSRAVAKLRIDAELGEDSGA